MTKRSRIILHGKQGANQELRDAVEAVRTDGHEIDVRVTWEARDSGLFAAEASKEGIDTVIAGGGDGTVNEVVNGLLQVEGNTSALGVIPLGTANDFARSAGISLQLEGALRVAVETEPPRRRAYTRYASSFRARAETTEAPPSRIDTSSELERTGVMMRLLAIGLPIYLFAGE